MWAHMESNNKNMYIELVLMRTLNRNTDLIRLLDGAL